MGHADKIVFYAKEMLADFSTKPKHILDPFLVAKLDLQSIKFFKFPSIPKELNKYAQRKIGVSGFDYILKCDKQAVCEIARAKEQSEEDGVQKNQIDALNRRQLNIPSLLQLYCNLCEFLRLRNEIILAAAESSVL